MKIATIVLLLLAAPLIAELSSEGNSLDNSYCTVTFDGTHIEYFDTSGTPAEMVIRFDGTEDTEVLLSNGDVVLKADGHSRKGVCTAVFDSVPAGRFSVSCDIIDITVNPEGKRTTAYWSSD